MKARIAALALLTLTAGSASADSGDVLAGAVVGAVIGSAIGSSSGPSVRMHYDSVPPPVIYGPPPVVSYGYAPPVVSYAPLPPVVVYPAPHVYYGPPAWSYPPAYGYGQRHRHHHHRDFDDGPRRWRGYR